MGRTLFAAATCMRLMTGGALAAVACTLTAAPYAAHAQAPAYSFDQPAQPMADALRAFARASGQQITFDEAAVRGKRAPALRGRYAPGVALGRLLAGSGLEATRGSSGVYIVRAAVVSNSVGGLGDADERVRQNERLLEASRGVPIVVTGTNIRGIAPESSPVLVYDRDQIRDSGVATAQQFIERLPQHFEGGANEKLGIIADASAGANISRGSSVNLRGLGAGSTLVLINGRRMAPTSNIGGFVDISTIPASAIERIEILTDGASSIYGGDAVAGVANFVLREDFDGVEASLRYGLATEGNLDEYRASLTAGTSWNTGNALLVYEFYDRDNLSAGDRDFSSNVPLPNDLLPTQRRHSVIANLRQDVSDLVSVDTDFLYSNRESNEDISCLTTIPCQEQTPVETESWRIGAGIDWNLSDGWVVETSGYFSRLTNERRRTDPGTLLSEQTTDSEIWAVDVLLTGGILDLPAETVRIALGAHYRHENFEGIFNSFTRSTELISGEERDVFAAFGEIFIPIFGPNNRRPAVERLEISLSGRIEDYSDFGTNFSPKIGLIWSPIPGLRLRGSYGTSFNPPPLGRVGANDGTATLLPNSFFSNILGVPAPPEIVDSVVLFEGGTAANLDAETSTSFTVGFDYRANWGTTEFSISSTYFDIDFEDRLGSTPTPDNVNALVAQNIAFGNPNLFPPGTIIFNPSSSEIQGTLSRIFTIQNPFGLDPLDSTILNRIPVVRNLARTVVRGIDLNTRVSFDLLDGRGVIGLNGSYLIDQKQQGSVTTALVEQVSTFLNPVDLRIRSQLGFSNDLLSLNAYVNFVDDYRVDSTAGSDRISAFTTVDMTLRFNLDNMTGNSLLSGTRLGISVLNLFNEEPPVAPVLANSFLVGYDPTNASPLGRFISFELTKRF
ncbi:MAG: TonB-dependent receptor [Pseudomonadota bacterium]